MLTRHFQWPIAGVIALLTIGIACAQEMPLGEDDEQDAETYFELSRSDDRTTRMTADRYLNLVKRQEWSDSTGKSKVMAKYVEHDPDMKWVKLEAAKGSGASRVVKEITVPINRLSKTCQSRVRQIDVLKKKLDELLAAGAGVESGDESAASGAEFADHGAPMLDERGTEPPAFGREAAPAEEARLRAPRPPADQGGAASGEFDPDPLGFAEMDLSTMPQGVGRENMPIPGMPLSTGPPAGNVDRKQWSTSYPAFHANFAVLPGEGGEPRIDWGELDELRTIGEAVAELQADRANQDTNAWADRLGEVQWEAPFQGLVPGERETRIAFDLPPLPPPLQIEFILDGEHLTPEEWSQVAVNPGNRVSFTGRVAMAGPLLIHVYVRDPKPARPASGR